MILRLHQLLPLLRTKLFIHSKTAPRPYKENYPLALGRTTIQGVQSTEDSNVLKPSLSSAKLRQMVHSTGRRIRLWRGRHTLTGG